MRCFLLVFAAVAALGQPVQKGFVHFYNLEYDDALREFREAAASSPNEPGPYNHIAQAILYREMFRTGALESELVSGGNPFLRRAKMNPPPSAVTEFNSSIQKSMELCDKRLAANPNDVPALYAKGVAHGLRANYNFLVNKAWLDALRDASAARKLHDRAVELQGNFTDARLVEGVHDYVVGSLPWTWKMLGFLAGVRGDREEGIRTLTLVAEKGNLNRYDAQVLLAAIYRRERRAEKAIPLLSSLIEKFPRNYLLQFELAQMYSDTGQKDKALAVFQRIEDLKKAGSPGFKSLRVEKIHYYRGNLLFWYGDYTNALENLKRVTPKSGDLDLNTGVMAWLRVGQIHDVTGKRSEAVAAYRQAVALAPQSAAAKESRDYMDSPYRRKDRSQSP